MIKSALFVIEGTDVALFLKLKLKDDLRKNSALGKIKKVCLNFLFQCLNTQIHLATLKPKMIWVLNPG